MRVSCQLGGSRRAAYRGYLKSVGERVIVELICQFPLVQLLDEVAACKLLGREVPLQRVGARRLDSGFELYS